MFMIKYFFNLEKQLQLSVIVIAVTIQTALQ